MLRITGGKVYDPANDVNGEVRDVCISRRQDRRRRRGRAHDRRHGHGRLPRRGGRPHARRRGRPQLRPGDDPGEPAARPPRSAHAGSPRAGIGGPRRPPSPPATSTPAWATPPSTRRPCPSSRAKHTHEELRDTPIVDKACCVLMANNEIVLDLLDPPGEDEQVKFCGRGLEAVHAAVLCTPVSGLFDGARGGCRHGEGRFDHGPARRQLWRDGAGVRAWWGDWAGYYFAPNGGFPKPERLDGLDARWRRCRCRAAERAVVSRRFREPCAASPERGAAPRSTFATG